MSYVAAYILVREGAAAIVDLGTAGSEAAIADGLRGPRGQGAAGAGGEPARVTPQPPAGTNARSESALRSASRRE